MSFEKAQLDNAVTAEDPMEQLIRSSIAPDLDRQKGRAAAAFAQMVQANPPAPPIHAADRRAIRRLKIWATAAASLAACLAAVVTLQVWMKSQSGRPTQPSPGTIAATDNTPVIDQVEYTRNLDAGTVLMGGAPVRVLRKQTLKQTQWTDPRDGATYSITEPAEKIGYEKVQPY